MRKLLVLALILSSISFSGGCDRKNAGPGNRSSAQTGGVAPAFILRNINGKDVTLSEYKGKIVLLEFWATWCPPCKATIPELIAIQDKYRDKGLVVLAISVDEGQDLPSKLSDFSRQHNINYAVLLSSVDVEKSYNISSVPVSFLIDREGKIVTSYLGYIDNFSADISGRIDKII